MKLKKAVKICSLLRLNGGNNQEIEEHRVYHDPLLSDDHRSDNNVSSEQVVLRGVLGHVLHAANGERGGRLGGCAKEQSVPLQPQDPSDNRRLPVKRVL